MSLLAWDVQPEQLSLTTQRMLTSMHSVDPGGLPEGRTSPEDTLLNPRVPLKHLPAFRTKNVEAALFLLLQLSTDPPGHPYPALWALWTGSCPQGPGRNFLKMQKETSRVGC